MAHHITIQIVCQQEKCAREFFILAHILVTPVLALVSRHLHHRTLAEKFFRVFVERHLTSSTSFAHTGIRQVVLMRRSLTVTCVSRSSTILRLFSKAGFCIPVTTGSRNWSAITCGDSYRNYVTTRLRLLVVWVKKR